MGLFEYIPIILILIVAIVFAVVIVLGMSLFGPKGTGKVKGEPYESGMTPIGTARIRFDVKFYLIAVLFILFDIEIIFMYPWAVVYNDLLSTGNFILIEMLVFIGILAIGYLYLWKKGAFEWD